MDSNSLFYTLELVAGNGQTLTAEQRTTLSTSLMILRKNYKFNRVLFWGKIFGVNWDYFIAQGRGEDEMKDRKNFYSFNCIDWFLLPPATDSMVEEVSRAAKGYFMGDPSYVYEHPEIIRQGESEEGKVFKVKEESRLAVTVHLIDEEASVVPRGAFIKNPRGDVTVNCSFSGLSHSEARKLNFFFHFREPKNQKKKSVLEFSYMTPALDFLDALSDDIFKESWSLQFECGKVCILRSLLWRGLTFYHIPATPQHGYIYIGDGTKNLDLPFML